MGKPIKKIICIFACGVESAFCKTAENPRSAQKGAVKEMALRKIVKNGDEILKKKCKKVEKFDKKLHVLLDDMKETLYDANGAGLAAPQVGILKRVCVVDAGDENGFMEFVNPEITAVEGEQYGPEGCLSFPGEYGLVRRPVKVTVRAQDRDGNFFEKTGVELCARAFCHEIDHLDGVVFTDKVTRMLSTEELESGSYCEETGEAQKETPQQ